MSTFTFQGTIIDSITGATIEGLRVAVHSVDQTDTEPLLLVTTDTDGTFLSVLDVDALVSAGRLPAGGTATAYFRVTEGALEVLDTHEDPWLLRDAVTVGTLVVVREVVGYVDGIVADPKTGPIADANVELIRRQLSGTAPGDVILAQLTTADNGRYRLNYNLTDGRAVNLLARATTTSGQVIESELVCNAPAALTLDLIVGGGAWTGESERELLVEALAREVGTTRLEVLTSEAVELLACSTMQPADRVAMLVAAHQSALVTGMSVDLFYGMARFGVGGIFTTCWHRRSAHDSAPLKKPSVPTPRAMPREIPSRI